MKKLENASNKLYKNVTMSGHIFLVHADKDYFVLSLLYSTVLFVLKKLHVEYMYLIFLCFEFSDFQLCEQ